MLCRGEMLGLAQGHTLGFSQENPEFQAMSYPLLWGEGWKETTCPERPRACAGLAPGWGWELGPQLVALD